MRSHSIESARGVEGRKVFATKIVLEKDGMISSCTGTGREGGETRVIAGYCGDLPRKMEPMLDKSGRPVRRIIELTQSVDSRIIED